MNMEEKKLLNRSGLKFYPLGSRINRVEIETEKIDSQCKAPKISEKAYEATTRAAEAIRKARNSGRPVILAFGAHAIKNGLGPLLIAFSTGPSLQAFLLQLTQCSDTT
jgi:hypothetical protein